jgi:hypothetical protein
MAITRLGGANAISGTLPAANINDTSIGNITALPAGVGGKVLQVVQATKTDTFTHTGTGFTVVTGLTASITPSSTSNKIFITVSVNGQRNVANNTVGQITIFKDDSNLINASSPGSRNPSITSGVQMGDTNGDVNSEIYSFSVLNSPSTTSEITYDVRVRNAGGSEVTYINRSEEDVDAASKGRGISTITLMEIAG